MNVTKSGRSEGIRQQKTIRTTVTHEIILSLSFSDLNFIMYQLYINDKTLS